MNVTRTISQDILGEIEKLLQTLDLHLERYSIDG